MTAQHPVKREGDVGNYFTITYTELFKAHVLDVHLPNLLIGISASIEVPLVTILGRRIHSTYSEIADFITVSALSRTVLDIPIGIIVEYVGVRNVMFLCLLLNIAASIVGFNVVNGTMLFTFCLLSGLSLGGFFLARHIFVAGISSKKYRGFLMSILSGLLRWSHVIGPVASGLFATYWGDVKYSFLLSAATSSVAFTTLAIATYSMSYQHICEHSCTTSLETSALPTPLYSEEEDEMGSTSTLNSNSNSNNSNTNSSGPSAPLVSSALPTSGAYVSTPLMPPAAPATNVTSALAPTELRAPAGRSSSTAAGTTTTDCSSIAATSNMNGSVGDHPVIVGAETSVTLPPLPAHHFNRLHHAQGYSHSASFVNKGVSVIPDGCSNVATATTVASVHPDMSASRVHHFGVLTLWSTFVDYWTVIWRLGLYVVFATAMRANRKLLISFAGMRASMTDAQVSYLMGFGFVFDAVLFPLGGLVMDLLGRQFAMVPVAVGLGIVFFFLPFATTKLHLYMASSAFGFVDALGCGLLMTLTADRAPPRYGAPFFGIMRTLQDFGHVVGARGVSTLMRYAGFKACCWTLTATGFLTAVWGVYGVPSDNDVPAETPRLKRAVLAQEQHNRRKSLGTFCSNSNEETALLTGSIGGEAAAAVAVAALAGSSQSGKPTSPPTVLMPAVSYGTTLSA